MPWGSETATKFITNVALLTTRSGEDSDNIMACEWTHQVSYSPALLAVGINKKHTTYDNVSKSKEIGVGLASIKQSSLTSIAGGYSGKNYDKVAALKELGYSFYTAEKINCLMVEETALNMECKVINEVVTGDHILLILEVLKVTSKEEPLAYHKGKYFAMSENLKKPSAEEREKQKEIVEKHKQ